MAATTDYDAPRRSALDDDTATESLDALTAARTDKQPPSWISMRPTPGKAWSRPVRTYPART